jgi:uncharacterized protein (TIGR03435 family)
MLRIPLTAALLLPLSLCPQTAVEPSFEVAAVKANRMAHAKDEFKMLPSGLVRIRHASMKDLIQGAWNLEDYAVTGGPGWIDGDYFDVMAKTPPNTPTPMMEHMLQNLLKERFRLQLHTEARVMPVFVMLVAKGGLKIRESSQGSDANCKIGGTRGILSVACTGTQVAGLAAMLPQLASGYIQIPVLDKTGLSGYYDFTLSWTGRGVLDAVGSNGEIARGDDWGGGNGLITVFEALQEQLGLKLEGRKEAVTITVIDHVERLPVEDHCCH